MVLLELGTSLLKEKVNELKKKKKKPNYVFLGEFTSYKLLYKEFFIWHDYDSNVLKCNTTD